jgi:GTPase SAR1 family protein
VGLIRRLIRGTKDGSSRACGTIDSAPAGLQSRSTSTEHGIELTEEFRQALETFELGTSSPLLVTGNAGTGKSTLLQHFRRNTKKNVVVLAPTGMAAINVRGVTIHSFFKFPPRFLQKSDIRAVSDRMEVFRKIDTLIIDEISMVRADLLDAVDLSLRLHRSDRRPFGGVQILFFGDVGQLPPVVTGRELEDYFSDVYKTPWFFSAKALRPWLDGSTAPDYQKSGSAVFRARWP